MHAHPSESAAGLATSATAVVALVSATWLVVGANPPPLDPLPQPAARFFRPQETAMPEILSLCTRIAALRQRLTALSPRVDRLESLDARMLADLGIDRSDIGSIEFESRRHATATRLRIVEAAGHA
jgi:hypothetical protein